MNRKQWPAILLALLLILFAGSLAWTLTHRAGPHADTTVTRTVREPDHPSSADRIGQTDGNAITLVKQWERLSRDWGTDALISPDSLKVQPASTVLDRLHAGMPDTDPTRDLMEHPVDDPTRKPSPACDHDMQSMTCALKPDWRSWWPGEAWAYGARWTGEPKTNVQGDRIIVTGTVRAILLMDDDTYRAGDRHALTPAWRDMPIHDEILIHDNRIRSVTHRNANPWWIDPWHEPWSVDWAADMTGPNTRRIAIPIIGQPAMNLSHTGDAVLLKAPKTMGDLDGNVDWSLWDGETLTANGAQNQRNVEECKREYGDQCPLV